MKKCVIGLISVFPVVFIMTFLIGEINGTNTSMLDFLRVWSDRNAWFNYQDVSSRINNLNNLQLDYLDTSTIYLNMPQSVSDVLNFFKWFANLFIGMWNYTIPLLKVLAFVGVYFIQILNVCFNIISYCLGIRTIVL